MKRASLAASSIPEFEANGRRRNLSIGEGSAGAVSASLLSFKDKRNIFIADPQCSDEAKEEGLDQKRRLTWHQASRHAPGNASDSVSDAVTPSQDAPERMRRLTWHQSVDVGR